jgi:hypothetical protein
MIEIVVIIYGKFQLNLYDFIYGNFYKFYNIFINI